MYPVKQPGVSVCTFPHTHLSTVPLLSPVTLHSQIYRILQCQKKKRKKRGPWTSMRYHQRTFDKGLAATIRWQMRMIPTAIRGSFFLHGKRNQDRPALMYLHILRHPLFRVARTQPSDLSFAAAACNSARALTTPLLACGAVELSPLSSLSLASFLPQRKSPCAKALAPLVSPLRSAKRTRSSHTASPGRVQQTR